MDDPRAFVYRVDANDRILRVSPEWVAFAVENQAPELTEEAVVGRELWEFVHGLEVQSLYRNLFSVVRDKRSRIRLPFRCDSPSTRRFMELTVLCSEDGELELQGRLKRAEARVYLGVLDTRLPRSRRAVDVCSLCKRARVAGRGWCDLDDALGVLDVFSAREQPALSHGLCDACASDVGALIGGNEVPA